MNLPITTGYIIYFALSLLANAEFFFAVCKLYGKKKLIVGKMIIYAAVNSICLVLANSLVNNEPFTYLIIFGMATLFIVLLLKIKTEDGLLIGLFVVFHYMVLKGIVVGTMSLIITKNMYQVLLVDTYSSLVRIISVTGLAIAIVIYMFFIDKEAYQALVTSRTQKFFVLVAHMILGLFLLFYSYNYYYNMEMIWFSVAQVLTSVIMLACYIVVARYGMTVSRLLTVDIRRQQLQEKLESQLGQYHHYQTLAKQVQIVRHDINELSVSASYLLDQGDIKGAKGVIEESTRTIEHKLPDIQKYSNNILIDALLTETRGICQANDIAFKAKVYVPDHLAITEKNLHTCVYNLVQNAVEACERMSKNQMRFVDIESTTKKNWLTIKVTNSYSGVIKMHDGVIDSRKTDDNGGRGIKICKDIIEASRGMVNISIDKERRIFTISIHIYYATVKGEPEINPDLD